MTIREISMPTSKYNIKCPYAMTPEFVVIHNTANDASALNEIKYMQSNDKEVSFHYAVDDNEAVQGVPLNRNAWHAGDGGNGKGNRKGIAIEICYSKSGGDRFTKAEQNAAELTATLLTKYGWDISHVKKHQDFSGKYCPHRTLDLGWQRFLDMVSAELSKTSKASTATAKTYKDSYELSGITITRAKDFAIRYLDKDKRRGCAARYINAGFFAVYRAENSNTMFTLPIGNLACDITSIPTAAEKYLTKHVYGQHLVYSIADNASAQFKGKQVSTLLVDYQGNAKIERVSAIPSGCQYAISGLPVIINSQPVTWAYVKAEGWDDSTTYNTSRNLIGLRNGDIWILTAKTTTANYITSQELWNKLKDEGFTDVIALDGGGSYIRVENCRRRSTGGSRAINNIIVF